MEVKKEMFDKIRATPPARQEALLKEAGFEMLRDAVDYHGKIIDSSDWLTPDFESVENYLRSVYEDADEADERIEKYKIDYLLSEEERADFKNYEIAHVRENEYHPGLFSGELWCGDETLVVVTERTGGGWYCQAKFIATFPSVEEALVRLVGAGSELI